MVIPVLPVSLKQQDSAQFQFASLAVLTYIQAGPSAVSSL